MVWSVAGGDSRGIIPEQVLSAGALRIVVVEIVAEGDKYFYYYWAIAQVLSAGTLWVVVVEVVVVVAVVDN